MPLGDRVLDNGLTVLDTEANRLDICKTLPTTYAEATSTYTVGNKLNPSIGAPAAATPNGRKVTVSVPQESGGTVTATSTGASDDAEYWAITDTVNSRLLAAGSLAAGQLVTSGNTWYFTADFDIRIPNQ